ncbi:hypothetical protein ACTA71_000426 [Dictyostelium dimigraforme]
MIRNSYKYMVLVQRTLGNKNGIIFNSSIGLISKNNNINNNKNNKIQYRNFSSSKQSFGKQEEDEHDEESEYDESEYDESEYDENGLKILQEGEETGETTKERFDKELNEELVELENEILDVQPPLYYQIKYELYRLHHDDPEFWDVKRLSQVFTLHPGRVVALIRFVEIEKMEIEKGFPTYPEFEHALAEDWGCRFEDEDLEEDDNQKVNDYELFSLQKGIGRNAKSINQNYLHQKEKSNKKSRGKPDPIHETPTKIPEAYDDQPIYFRGPTYVLPRKKNLVFVDTSRDPITKKVNPDPMVLIQGIDGSLRTPSTKEKSIIINKVRPEKVKRDYDSILKRPIKYRLPSQQFPKAVPIVESESIENLENSENQENLENQVNN